MYCDKLMSFVGKSFNYIGTFVIRHPGGVFFNNTDWVVDLSILDEAICHMGFLILQ